MNSSIVPKFSNTERRPYVRNVHINVHVPEPIVVRLDILRAQKRTMRKDEVLAALTAHLDREEQALAAAAAKKRK